MLCYRDIRLNCKSSPSLAHCATSVVGEAGSTGKAQVQQMSHINFWGKIG